MKSYDVEITVTFKKSMRINACCGDAAIEKTKDILFNTDLIEFSEEDLKSVICEAESIREESCDCCDEDCNECCEFDEREYLYDELY